MHLINCVAFSSAKYSSIQYISYYTLELVALWGVRGNHFRVGINAHQVSSNESHFKHLLKKTIYSGTLKAHSIILRDHILD